MAATPHETIFHLPCSLGDTIYIIIPWRSGEPNHIRTAEVIGIHFTTIHPSRKRYGKEYRYLVVQSDYGSADHIDMKKIGDRVFFTEEEAKARLHELKVQWNLDHSKKEK